MSYGNRGRGRGGYGGQYNGRNGGNSQANLQNNIDQFTAQNAVPVEILGWNNTTHEECISFLSRKTRIAVFDHSVDPLTGILKGYVKNQKEANDLVSWSGVKFANQSLRITKAGTANSFLNQLGSSTSSSGNVIELITQFLKSRYNPEIKMLNLSMMKQDPSLSSIFSLISTGSKFFPAMMKIAGDLKIKVESIDLSNNELNDIASITTLSQTFPKLKNLSLINNNILKIKSFDNWKSKLNFLRELLIHNNPLVNIINNQEIINLKLEFMKIFPRLILLNGEILRNESNLISNLSFQFDSIQSMFFQDESIQEISTNFITNFLKLWDFNRSNLMILYKNQSQFSIQVDTSHPHLIDSNSDFNYYLPLSRNLCRVSNPKQRLSRLNFGQDEIFKIFQQLPKSKHDLINKPLNYSIECFKIPQLNGINIILHGEFDEINQPDNLDAINGLKRFNQKKKILLEKRCFDRTFIVIPGVDGSMVVASDMLSIRPYTEPDAWKSIKPTPSVADLPADVKIKLNPIQQELIVKIVIETKLNLQYGFMLCEQSNWDYQQCILNFQNSAATLPKEAYT